MSAEPIPVACTLTTADAAKQALEWIDLQTHAISASALSNGARMRFSDALEDHIVDLAAREATCCAFLTITTVATDGELVLEVTSDNPDAKPVIEMLAGISIP